MKCQVTLCLYAKKSRDVKFLLFIKHLKAWKIFKRFSRLAGTQCQTSNKKHFIKALYARKVLFIDFQSWKMLQLFMFNIWCSLYVRLKWITSVQALMWLWIISWETNINRWRKVEAFCVQEKVLRVGGGVRQRLLFQQGWKVSTSQLASYKVN